MYIKYQFEYCPTLTNMYDEVSFIFPQLDLVRLFYPCFKTSVYESACGGVLSFNNKFHFVCLLALALLYAVIVGFSLSLPLFLSV